MIQRRRGLGFPLEPLKGVRVGRQLVGQELERHVPTEREVLGLVDHTHTPSANLAKDLVMREGGSDHRPRTALSGVLTGLYPSRD